MTLKEHTHQREWWALQWRSKNRLDGETCHFIRKDLKILTFTTREAARNYRDQHYSYIKARSDLQKEPFGWKMPKVIKVMQTTTVIATEDRR